MKNRNSVRFAVHAKPEPAGSKTAFVVKGTNRAIVTDANKKAKPWKESVAKAATEAMEGEPPFEGPLVLAVTFYLERPKTVTRTYPTVKPDTTKLLRGLEDALTGITYLDDAQIVNQIAFKRYCKHKSWAEVKVLCLGSGEDWLE